MDGACSQIIAVINFLWSVYWFSPSNAKGESIAWYSGIKQTVHSPTKPDEHTIFWEGALSVPRFSNLFFFLSFLSWADRSEASFIFVISNKRYTVVEKKKNYSNPLLWHGRYACSIGIEWNQREIEQSSFFSNHILNCFFKLHYR